MFRQHPVHVGGLLIQRGQREWTTMTMSDGPPDDDEKGGNVEILWAYDAIYF